MEAASHAWSGGAEESALAPDAVRVASSPPPDDANITTRCMASRVEKSTLAPDAVCVASCPTPR